MESPDPASKTLQLAEAEKLNQLFLRIGAHLDQSTAFAREHDSREEFETYCRHAGKVMGEVYFELMLPLWARFPELRPDYLDGPYRIPPETYEPLFYDNRPSKGDGRGF